MADEKKDYAKDPNKTLHTIEDRLTKLSNKKTPLEQVEGLGRLYKSIQDSTQKLAEIMPAEQETLLSATRLEYKANGLLYLFSHYSLILRAPPQNRKLKARELIPQICAHIAEMQQNVGNSIDEKVAAQKMTLFYRAMFTHTLIFAEAPISQIISAATYFMYELERFRNFTRLRNLTASDPCMISAERLDTFIKEISNRSCHHIFISAGFSEHDKMFIGYLASCSSPEPKVSPESFATALLEFDFAPFEKKLPRAIATALLSPKPIRDETITMAAQILGQMRFMQLQLTGFFHQKDALSDVAKTALLERLRLYLPKLNAYRILSGYSAEFGFLGDTPSSTYDTTTIVDEKAYLIKVSQDFSALDDFNTLCTFFTICRKLRADPDVIELLRTYIGNTPLTEPLINRIVQNSTREIGKLMSAAITPQELSVCREKYLEIREEKESKSGKTLESQVITCLVLFCDYQLQAGGDNPDKNAVSAWLELCSHFVRNLQADNESSPTEQLLIQRMKIFLLALRPQMLLLVQPTGQSLTTVIASLFHFLCQIQIYRNIAETYTRSHHACTQKDSAQYDETLTDLINEGIFTFRRMKTGRGQSFWTYYATTTFKDTLQFINASKKVSDPDKAFIHYCKDNLEAVEEPALPTMSFITDSKLLQFKPLAFITKIQSAIKAQIPLDNHTKTELLRIAKLLFLKIWLTGVYARSKHIKVSSHFATIKNTLAEILPWLYLYRDTVGDSADLSFLACDSREKYAMVALSTHDPDQEAAELVAQENKKGEKKNEDTKKKKKKNKKNKKEKPKTGETPANSAHADHRVEDSAPTAPPYALAEEAGVELPSLYEETPPRCIPAAKPPVSLEEYLARAKWIPADTVEFNCPPVDRMMDLFNPLANENTKFKFATFLMGGALRDLFLKKKPKDWDVKIVATAGEILDMLESHRERLKIDTLTFIEEGHPHFIVTFTDAPGVVLDVAPIDNTLSPHSLHRFISEFQGTLDYNVNSLFYTQLGGHKFMRDSQGALNALETLTLNRIEATNQATARITTIMIRGAMLLQKCPEFKPSDELLGWFENNKGLLATGAAKRTFVKLLYTDLACEALNAMHRFGFLEKLCPELIPALENTSFMDWVKTFVNEKGAKYRERAATSQDEFENVHREVLQAYRDKATEKKSNIKVTPFTFKPQNNGQSSRLLFTSEEAPKEDATENSHVILPPTTNIGSPRNGNGN